jgi:lysozyme family protein
MANFNIAYGIVHKNEGGYANVASDRGGETYCGIARNYQKQWHGWVLIDNWKALHGTPKRGEYIETPGLVDEVVAFYRVRWDDIMGDKLHSQPIANQLYDFATGTGRAVKIAQQVLIDMGAHLTADNAFGPATLAAVNAADEATFYRKLREARIAYYRYLVQQNPSQGIFLNNWLARANAFVDLQKKTLVHS